MKNKPQILLLAGNSGTGKTFLIEQIVQKYPEKFVRIPSLTTKKTTEKDQYLQISEAQFLKKLGLGEIIFPADKEVFGAYYGVSKTLLEEALNMDKIPIITSNLVGLATFPEDLRGQTLIVAMISNDHEFVHKRLTLRSRPEDAEQIEKRVKISQEEWQKFYLEKTWRIPDLVDLLYKIRNNETIPKRILPKILMRFGLELEIYKEIKSYQKMRIY